METELTTDYQPKPFSRGLKILESLRRGRGLSLLLAVSERYQNSGVDVIAELDDGLLKFRDKTFSVEIQKKGFSVLSQNVDNTVTSI